MEWMDKAEECVNVIKNNWRKDFSYPSEESSYLDNNLITIPLENVDQYIKS